MFSRVERRESSNFFKHSNFEIEVTLSSVYSALPKWSNKFFLGFNDFEKFVNLYSNTLMYHL